MTPPATVSPLIAPVVEATREAKETTTDSRSASVTQRLPEFHIPSLDGLRALSFFIVFLAHSGLDVGLPFLAMPGGFGVTVFFYLSGFLITTLLRLERETTGSISIKKFYLRRALRILPPFYLSLLLAASLTVVHVLPGHLRGGVLAAQALHVSNYWFIWRGFEGTPAGTAPYWSLAVEEHFYLLFPLVYLGLSRMCSNRRQGYALWTLCAITCAWRCILVLGLGVDDNRTYMGSDTRFDSILFGCALAVVMNPMLDRPSGSDRLWKAVLLPAGVALLLFTFVYRAPWFRETVRYSLQGVALTSVFVAAMRFPAWWPFRALNTKPVAFVGVLSYTLYLTHQIVITAVQFWLPALQQLWSLTLALAIAFAIALAIHRFVEEPAARIRKRLARGGVARAPVAVR